VVSAKLRLFGNRPTASANTDTVLSVGNITWSETSINWVTKPGLGVAQGPGMVIQTAAQVYEWDVLNHVSAQKSMGAAAVSLAVRMDGTTSNSPDSFSSREAATNRPQLVVTTTP
jgi:hypothetical protein